MVEVQAKSLEEYDLFLEEVKSQLSIKKFSDNENDRDFFTEELQLESLQDEVMTFEFLTAILVSCFFDSGYWFYCWSILVFIKFCLFFNVFTFCVQCA